MLSTGVSQYLYRLLVRWSAVKTCAHSLPRNSVRIISPAVKRTNNLKLKPKILKKNFSQCRFAYLEAYIKGIRGFIYDSWMVRCIVWCFIDVLLYYFMYFWCIIDVLFFVLLMYCCIEIWYNNSKINIIILLQSSY